MKTTILVEGMKCHHCEAHVQNEISKIQGVKKVIADKTKNEVEIESENSLNEEELKAVIQNVGYSYKGIKE